jgi:hypothetical protein
MADLGEASAHIELIGQTNVGHPCSFEFCHLTPYRVSCYNHLQVRWGRESLPWSL